MKKERPHIFYDQFRSYVETGAWLPAAVSPTHPAYKAGMQRVLRVLSASQIRILDPDVVQFAVDLANKAGKQPVPYVPYPRYPMWIEFGGDTLLGDSITQYKAIWAFPAQDRADIHFDLITLDGQSKSLFVREDGTRWSYEQGGACDVQACVRARQTTPGEPYEIGSGEARSLMLEDCVCAGAGWQWAQLLFLIGHLLRLPRSTIQETVTRRDLPLPRDAFKRQQVEAENKRYPRYVTLSLTQPITVSAHPFSKRSASSSPADPTLDYLETHPVAGHSKILIPGEGKPWKDLQIFHVESYERRGKPGETPTRYIIQP